MFPELKAIDNREHFLPMPGKRNGTKCHQFLTPTWAQAVPKHLHVSGSLTNDNLFRGQTA